MDGAHLYTNLARVPRMRRLAPFEEPQTSQVESVWRPRLGTSSGGAVEGGDERSDALRQRREAACPVHAHRDADLV